MQSGTSQHTTSHNTTIPYPTTMGNANLAPRAEPWPYRFFVVDLNINGEYEGIYVIMEKLKRDTQIIDIDKDDGYILKVDRDESKQNNFTDENSFRSKFGSDLERNASDVHYLYEYPKPSKITQGQTDYWYISNYVNDFEISLAADDFKHPTNGNGYEEYVDVDMWIVLSISHRNSGNNTS
ncbi:unnamed protein product [Laminaria digitata]